MNKIFIIVSYLVINILLTEGRSKVDRPVIGILAEKVTDKSTMKMFNWTKGREFIAASYVKFLESAGARVVPINNKFTKKNLTFIFNSINGLLLPGGDVNLINSPYYETGKKLFSMASRANRRGDYFPILGICLGYESLLSFVEGSSHFLEDFDSENMSLPVKLYDGFRGSNMFKHLPRKLENALQYHKLTFDNHAKGVSPREYWKSKKLSSFYRLLGTSQGRDKKTFIAAIEGEHMHKYLFKVRD